MVFLVDLIEGELLITYGLFGVQHEILTPEKRKMILDLYSLLSQSAGRIDHLQDQSHGLPRDGPTSTTFVAYWLHSSDYEAWKETPAVKEFWEKLPDDAGVWREVMTVPKSRFMHAANQNIESGIATLPELNLTPSNDEGYWGVYRHRLSMVPDSHTDPTDAFTSPYVTSAKSNPAAPVINIPPSRTGKIVPGRVKLDHIRDNIVFVREGQRQPNLEQEELDTWRESIAPHVESWIEHLDTERNKNGVLAFTTHISHEQPPMIDTKRRDSAVELDLAADLEKLDVNSDSDAKAVPETNQLAYFLDLAHFELAGRSFKGHVQLRRNTIELYGPGGKHEGEKGKVVLFVELCVLKKGDLDAEYVGCMEGTGLMYLRDLDV